MIIPDPAAFVNAGRASEKGDGSARFLLRLRAGCGIMSGRLQAMEAESARS